MSLIQWGTRNKLLVTVIALLLLPVIMAGYLLFAFNQEEQNLMQSHQKNLNQLVDEMNSSMLEKADKLGLTDSSQTPDTEKIGALNDLLHSFVKANSENFPELEVGFYSRRLHTMVVQGSGDYYLGRSFPTIKEDILKDPENQLSKIKGQRSGTVIETYKPFIVNGKVEGLIWGTENLNLTGIQSQIDATKHFSFAVIGFSFFFGLGGSVVLIKRFITSVHNIKAGLSNLELDLNYSLPPMDGEFGEIITAINHLSGQLIKAKSFNEISLASINDAVVAVDIEGKIITANPAAIQVLNFDPNCLGRDYNEAMPAGSPFPGILRSAMEGDLVREHRVSWCPPGSSAVELLVSTAHLVNSRQEIVGAVLSCLDITESVRLQERVNLQERLASLGKLVAGVAHEVRNPLTAISGYIEYLEKTDHPSPRSWRNIFREINRLNLIVEKLLFFAKPAEAMFVPGDINSLVENALSFFLETNQDRVIVIRELKPGLPPARMDLEQIERALKNIIFNAFQAMPGGGELKVRTGVCDEDMLYIEIGDTGCGIDKADLPFLFDPFFSKRAGGTGLGLTIAHEIVSAHGGAIEIISEPGLGSTFRIKLQAAGGENN